MIHDMEHWLAYEAWRVICCSEYMASHVSWALGLPREKVDVIPNGVDWKEYAKPYDRKNFRKRFASPREKLVLFVGRLVHEKGASVLVEAIPKILSKVDAKFMIVGDGYMRDQLISRAQALHVEAKVYATGFLDDETVKLLFRTADVCVVPSLYEPFGIVALEAMAAKAPLVVSDVGGLSEIVEHDKTGVKIYANSPDSLAWAVTRVLTDTRYADTLRNSSYEQVRQVYDWNTIAARTKAVYERVLEESRSRNWKI
jgi:glycogen(starch) synthase